MAQLHGVLDLRNRVHPDDDGHTSVVVAWSGVSSLFPGEPQCLPIQMPDWVYGVTARRPDQTRTVMGVSTIIPTQREYDVSTPQNVFVDIVPTSGGLLPVSLFRYDLLPGGQFGAPQDSVRVVVKGAPYKLLLIDFGDGNNQDETVSMTLDLYDVCAWTDTVRSVVS